MRSPSAPLSQTPRCLSQRPRSCPTARFREILFRNFVVAHTRNNPVSPCWLLPTTMDELSDWAIRSVVEQSAKEIGNRGREVAEADLEEWEAGRRLQSKAGRCEISNVSSTPVFTSDLHLAEIKRRYMILLITDRMSPDRRTSSGSPTF